MMRERPLSITLIGWINIVTFPILVVFILALPYMPSIGAAGDTPSKTLTGFNLLVTALVFAFAIGLLRGTKSARPAYVFLRVLGLAGSLLLDPILDAQTLAFSVLCIAVEAWLLYRPLGGKFFNGEGEPPALTHQAMSALYFAFTASILATGIGMCGYSGYMYKTSFIAAAPFVIPAVIIYAIGALVGLLIKPKRDTGGILIAGALLGFGMALSGTMAPSPEHPPNPAFPELAAGYNPWLAGLVALAPMALGAVLIYLSSVEDGKLVHRVDALQSE